MNSFKLILLITLVTVSLCSPCEDKIPHKSTDCISLSNSTDACCMFSIHIPGILNQTNVCQPINVDNAYLAPYVSTINILENRTEYMVSTSINCGLQSELIDTCTNSPKNAYGINDCMKYGNSTGSCCYLGSDTAGTCYYPAEFKSTNTKRNGAVLQCSKSNVTNDMPAVQTVIVDVIDIGAKFASFTYISLIVALFAIFF